MLADALPAQQAFAATVSIAPTMADLTSADAATRDVGRRSTRRVGDARRVDQHLEKLEGTLKPGQLFDQVVVDGKSTGSTVKMLVAVGAWPIALLILAVAWRRLFAAVADKARLEQENAGATQARA